MKRKRRILNIPFLKGMSSEETTKLAIADGKNSSLTNVRPYRNMQIRRYGDKLLGNKISAVTPLGLFYYTLGSSYGMLMPTSDGVLSVLPSLTGTWTSVSTDFNLTSTWDSTKFLSAIDNTTYIVLTNGVEDIQFWKGMNGVTPYPLVGLTALSAVTSILGDNTTQVQVSMSGSDATYTYTGVGTAPGIGLGYQVVGDAFTVAGFTNTINNVTGAYIKAVGTNSITIVNAGGVNDTHTVSSLSVGKSAPHRPIKASCVETFGGMLIAANCTALKPLTVKGDTVGQIAEIDLTGITAGHNLYWELINTHTLVGANASTTKFIDGILSTTFTISGNVSSMTISSFGQTLLANGGTGYYKFDANAHGSSVLYDLVVGLYSDAALTNQIATSQIPGTSTYPQVAGTEADFIAAPSKYTINPSNIQLYDTNPPAPESFDQNVSTTQITVTTVGDNITYTYTGAGQNPNFGKAIAGNLFTSIGFAAANNNVTNKIIDYVTANSITVTSSGGGTPVVAFVGASFTYAQAPFSAILKFEGFGVTQTKNGSGSFTITSTDSSTTGDQLTFNLYTDNSFGTVASTGTYTSNSNLFGTTQKLTLEGIVAGTVSILVQDVVATKNVNQYIEIANETDPMLVRWCDPYQPTKWGQFSYEKLQSSRGGILGMLVVSGQLYFLCYDTIHRAILTGDIENPLRFEYDVSPVGCPSPDTALEYLGRLVFMGNDGSWRAFDGFRAEILSADISSLLATSAPSCAGHNTRKSLFYFNNTVSGSKNKLLGGQADIIASPIRQTEDISMPLPTYKNMDFFGETHSHATSINKMASTDGSVYAACVDGTGTYVVSMNDASQTSYDLTNTPITFDVTTKEFILGDNLEAHLLNMVIFGDSNNTAVNVVVTINGTAMTTMSVVLNQYGIQIPIEQMARTVGVQISSPATVPTSFYIDKIEIEEQNPRLR